MPRRNLRRVRAAQRSTNPNRPAAHAEAVEPRVLLAAGDADLTFGMSRVGTDFGGHDEARAVVVMRDGDVVVAGTTRKDAEQPNLALARYHPDGTLDPTFGGGDGKVVRHLHPDRDDRHDWTLLEMPDGDFVVALVVREGPADAPVSRLALARFNADGTVDRGFGGGDGWVSDRELHLPADTWLSVEAVAATADGRILIGGSTVTGGPADSPTIGFALVRLTPDGRRDSGFGGGDGVQPVDFGPRSYSVVNDLAVLAGGDVLLAGTARLIDSQGDVLDPDVALARLHADGSPDTRFGGGDGRVVLPQGEYVDDVSLSPAGDYFLAVGRFRRLRRDGSVDPAFAPSDPPFFGLGHTELLTGAGGKLVEARDDRLVRFDRDGSPDDSFGDTGAALGDFEIRDVAPDDAGGFVTAGGFFGDFAVSRFTQEGRASPGFGHPLGKSLRPLAGPGQSAEVVDSRLLPDGRLLVLERSPGFVHPAARPDFVLARYDPAGNPDRTFGDGGRVEGDFGPLDGQPGVMEILPEGDVLVAGAVREENTYSAPVRVAFVRYNADGTVDRRFGRDGAAVLDEPTPDAPVDLAAAPGGKILAATESRVFRLNGDGTLDRSFGRGGEDGDGVITPDIVVGVVAPLPGGYVLVAGSDDVVNPNEYYGDTDFAAVRYNADGTIDRGFGHRGEVKVGFGNNYEHVDAVVPLPDGDVLLAGGSEETSPCDCTAAIPSSNGQIALVRLNPNGTRETRFGDRGRVTTSLGPAGGFNDWVRVGDVALLPDGDLLVAASAAVGTREPFLFDDMLAYKPAFFAARYNPDGRPDASFGAGGLAAAPLTDAFSAVARADAVAASPQGRLTLVGGVADALAVARFLLPAESLDDPDDQLPEARAVEVGGSRTDSVAAPRDVDLYRFTAARGQRLAFDVDRPRGSGLDAYLRLFNSDGVEIARNDNGAAPGEAGTGGDSYLEYLFSRGGTYYVGVSGRPNRSYDPATGGEDLLGTRGGYTLRLLG